MSSAVMTSQETKPISIRQIGAVCAGGEVTFEVTMQPGAFFAPHWHETVPADAQAETEAYQWTDGSLILYLRPNSSANWSSVFLNERTNLQMVVGGWQHAGKAGARGATFRVRTRKSHVLHPDQGGNVQWLPETDWPTELESNRTA